MATARKSHCRLLGNWFKMKAGLASNGEELLPMSSPPRTRILRRLATLLMVLVLLVAGLFAAIYAWYCYTYPYGSSHCCLKGIGTALHIYAERHYGHFPTGGSCPEASLSLLCRSNCDIDGYTLCGKTKSAEVAQAILERGELLGPDTCDWHYVEGLTLNDDDQIAIVWDKIGLDHNGRRLPKGGHSVLRLNGIEEVIPASEWQDFLKEQEQLLATRTEAARKGLPVLTAKIRLPSGEIVDHYNGSFSLHYTQGSGEGSTSGGELEASTLRWHKLFDGDYTFTLSLNGRNSKPVKVDVSDGIATPSSILFEMQTDGAKR
jgi:hypothetical protein